MISIFFLISIPESFLLMLISLVFLRQSFFFSKNNKKKNLLSVFLFATIPYSIFSRILNMLDINIYIRILLNSIMLSILIYPLLNIFGKKESIIEQIFEIGKVYICSLFSIFLLYIIEIFTISILQYLFNLDVSLIKSDIYVNFIFSIPSKLIFGSIIYLYYVKQNVNNNLISGLLDKNIYFFRIILFVQIIFTFLFSIYIHNKFVLNNILINLDSYTKFNIIFLIFIILLLEILFPWVIIASIRLNEYYKSLKYLSVDKDLFNIFENKLYEYYKKLNKLEILNLEVKELKFKSNTIKKDINEVGIFKENIKLNIETMDSMEKDFIQQIRDMQEKDILINKEIFEKKNEVNNIQMDLNDLIYNMKFLNGEEKRLLRYKYKEFKTDNWISNTLLKTLDDTITERVKLVESLFK